MVVVLALLRRRRKQDQTSLGSALGEMLDFFWGVVLVFVFFWQGLLLLMVFYLFFLLFFLILILFLVCLLYCGVGLLVFAAFSSWCRIIDFDIFSTRFWKGIPYLGPSTVLPPGGSSTNKSFRPLILLVTTPPDSL